MQEELSHEIVDLHPFKLWLIHTLVWLKRLAKRQMFADVRQFVLLWYPEPDSVTFGGTFLTVFNLIARLQISWKKSTHVTLAPIYNRKTPTSRKNPLFLIPASHQPTKWIWVVAWWVYHQGYLIVLILGPIFMSSVEKFIVHNFNRQLMPREHTVTGV